MRYPINTKNAFYVFKNSDLDILILNNFMIFKMIRKNREKLAEKVLEDFKKKVLKVKIENKSIFKKYIQNIIYLEKI